jgi:hypothetical protein
MKISIYFVLIAATLFFGSSTDEDPWFKIDKAICPGQDE